MLLFVLLFSITMVGVKFANLLAKNINKTVSVLPFIYPLPFSTHNISLRSSILFTVVDKQFHVLTYLSNYRRFGKARLRHVRQVGRKANYSTQRPSSLIHGFIQLAQWVTDFRFPDFGFPISDWHSTTSRSLGNC